MVDFGKQAGRVNAHQDEGQEESDNNTEKPFFSTIMFCENHQVPSCTLPGGKVELDFSIFLFI